MWYTCERMPESADSGGLMHVVEVDLTAPGVDLYVTPLDPDALVKGWEYQLNYASRVARNHNLAVAINATMFEHERGFISSAGDMARAVETAVAEHQVNHVYEHAYLVWFEDDLTPHVERTKPPSQDVLRRARWAVGGQGVAAYDGVPRDDILRGGPDERTVIGIDTARKRLWLAVFERATQRVATHEMVRFGAKEVVFMDGGDSTVMALGPGAADVRGGAVLGNWRPVATFFGVRAIPVERH
jgi:hypothetical protein